MCPGTQGQTGPTGWHINLNMDEDEFMLSERISFI